MPANADPVTTDLDNLTEDLPTDDEIRETFAALGLATSGPSGYPYLNLGGAQSGRVFEVVRTSTSAPRIA